MTFRGCTELQEKSRNAAIQVQSCTGWKRVTGRIWIAAGDGL